MAGAVWEQRADRSVVQARDQRFLLGLAAFALEEAARDAAAGVELLLVVDGEREEVLPLARGLVGDGADQQHGALARDHDRDTSLASDLAGFDGDSAVAVLRSEEPTSELQSLMRNPNAAFFVITKTTR